MISISVVVVVFSEAALQGLDSQSFRMKSRIGAAVSEAGGNASQWMGSGSPAAKGGVSRGAFTAKPLGGHGRSDWIEVPRQAQLGADPPGGAFVADAGDEWVQLGHAAALVLSRALA